MALTKLSSCFLNPTMESGQEEKVEGGGVASLDILQRHLRRTRANTCERKTKKIALESWALQKKKQPIFCLACADSIFLLQRVACRRAFLPLPRKRVCQVFFFVASKQRGDFLRRRRRRRRQTTEIAFVLRPDDPTYRRRRGTQNLGASKKGGGLCSVPYWEGAPPARVLARLGCIHGGLDKN